LFFAALIGFGSIVYKQLLFKFLVKPFQYKVVKVWSDPLLDRTT
jgi:hypothetical protein